MYKVDSIYGWFIVNTRTKRQAHSEGVEEFGRGEVTAVTKATEEDIIYFKSVKGEDSVTPSDRERRAPLIDNITINCDCGQLVGVRPSFKTHTGTGIRYEGRCSKCGRKWSLIKGNQELVLHSERGRLIRDRF